ncbi:hypothetical protein HU200_061433 [Digitaria exilis]|uniref:F-box associated domain-containing protein n=1 Tax=Digitaria exilis TaxID=1010633 RepID=A0A835ACM3_9POAL|nr:hypothetical protein HU200_061433 [Digitaria exilis]
MLAVWNPVAGEQRILPDLLPFETPWSNLNAAVLCAGGGGCDHIDCHRNGPFRVVFMITNREKMASYIYLSETNAWTESISPFLGKFCRSSRGAFVEKNSLYFVLETTPRILCYNLSTLELTMIDSPPMMNDRAWLMRNDRLALMTGSNINSQLYLWARNVDPDGHIRWALSKTIKLGMLKANYCSMLTLDVVGFVDGGGFIFVGTDRGAFATNLKSGCLERLADFIFKFSAALGMATIDEDPRGVEPNPLL